MNHSVRPITGIELLQGADAEPLLAGEAFRAEWLALIDGCPWATAFQSPAFVIDWYRAYRERYRPVLVISRDAQGRITGLLTLAVSATDGKLKVAGSHQAEYQAWICLAEQTKTFPRQALDLLRAAFPSAMLQFRYLPAQVPLGWLADRDQSRMAVLTPVRCPFMKFGDGSEIEESLRKSGNKSRLRQLKKFGAVEFSRVTDPAQFEPLLDEISRYHDCRQLASHGSAPFSTDPSKKAFHLALMNTPGLLHITVLRVGDQIASAHLNIIRNKEVQLFLIAHNPMLARFSPGKLHILFLARMLKQEGFQQLDLTPGGEEYKERFANAADTVHTLKVYPSFLRQSLGAAGMACEAKGRELLAKMNVKPAQLVSLASKARCLGPAGAAQSLFNVARSWTYSSREMQVYGFAAASARNLVVPDLIRRDCLEDLLAYQPDHSCMCRQEFMSAAVERLESGQHVYTYAQNGRLMVFGWLAEEAVEDTLAEIRLPSKSAAILEFQTFSRTPEHDLGVMSLRTMLRDAARNPELESIFITLSAKSLPALDAVKTIGFSYQASVFEQTRFGKIQRRVQMYSQPTQPRASDIVASGRAKTEVVVPLSTVRPPSRRAS
jgi:CelD/BcsL family acetyltransferase involved in cellulose biosynthesis